MYVKSPNKPTHTTYSILCCKDCVKINVFKKDFKRLRDRRVINPPMPEVKILLKFSGKYLLFLLSIYNHYYLSIRPCLITMPDLCLLSGT